MDTDLGVQGPWLWILTCNLLCDLGQFLNIKFLFPHLYNGE
jgi:hypothetical protein